MQRLAILGSLVFTMGVHADPLVELNAANRAAYRMVQVEVLAKSGPIIIASGDELVLIRAGQREEVTVVPKVYHERKAIAHVPLGLWVMLDAPEVCKLDDARKMHLTTIAERIGKARTHIATLDMPEPVKQRQFRILDESSKFIAEVLRDGRCTRKDLLAYVQRIQADTMENARDATIAQIDGMHAQVKRWRTRLTPEQWKEVRVIVVGGQMPRKQNLATQYFARLLGERGEGARIIYAESLWDEAKALNLLATHQIDRGVAIGFFDKPDRMEFDLLADFTTDYLKQLKWD